MENNNYEIIKELLKQSNFTDSDIKTIADYSDDFTIEQIKKDLIGFIRNMQLYLDIHKLDDEIEKYKNDDEDEYDDDEDEYDDDEDEYDDEESEEEQEEEYEDDKSNSIFDIILLGKGYSKKEIKELHKEHLIPFCDCGHCMLEDAYYDDIKSHLEHGFEDLTDQLYVYYDVDESDTIDYIYEAFCNTFNSPIDFNHDRVIFELNKLGLTKEIINKMEEYYKKDDFDYYGLSIPEIVEKVKDMDTFYQKHPNGIYLNSSCITASDIKAYDELFPDITHEQAKILDAYSDQYTIDKAYELSESDPDYFLKNIEKFINPKVLLMDYPETRRKLLGLILSKKGFSSTDIEQIALEDNSPLKDDSIDILLDSYYKRVGAKYNHNDYSSPKPDEDDYDFYEFDTFALMGNKMYEDLLKKAHLEYDKPIHYFDPGRVEYELSKRSTELDIEHYILVHELGYTIGIATTHLREEYYDRVVQNYRKYERAFGVANAKFLLLSGNVTCELQDIKRILKEDAEFIKDNEVLLDAINIYDNKIKSEVSFYKKYMSYSRKKLEDNLTKKYASVLTEGDVNRLIKETEIRIESTNTLKIDKEFNEMLAALTKIKPIKAQGIASALTATAGFVVTISSLGVVYVSSHFPEILTTINNAIIGNVNSNVASTTAKIGLGVLGVGTVCFADSIRRNIKNKKEIAEIDEKYQLRLR